MKQLLSLILCGIVLLSLCACSLLRGREETVPSTEPPALPPVTAAPKKDFEALIRDILAGSGSFYSRENRIYMTLDEYIVSGTGYESIPVAFTQAAGADMDGDGRREILLWLSEIEGGAHFSTLILSRGEGRVEGELFLSHDLDRLKTDGSYRWYGKHGSGGIARGGCDLAREEKADYSSPDDTMVFFVDLEAFGLEEGLPEEEAYRLAEEIQDAKTDVRWLPFPWDNPDALLNPSTEIDFRVLYRGFTPVEPDNREAFEAFTEIGTKVIADEEGWSAYMGRFCPGIPYEEAFDFSTHCLVASVIPGARPAYAQSHTLLSLRARDGYFVFEYDDTPGGCLALNTDGITHFYVEVLIIRKADLPANAEELIFVP